MSETTTSERIQRQLIEDGQLLRLTLDLGKGNIIDLAAIEELHSIVEEARGMSGLKGLVIDHTGDHFSFGASVEDHLPGQVERMLPSFHSLAKKMLGVDLPVLAAAHGQCLGGGLELALLADRIAATPTAWFGQPEIRLAVFAPLASLLLPHRIGKIRAADLLLSGRSVDAVEAQGIGLIDEISHDPLTATVAWARRHLLSKSAAALRLATRASRTAWVPQFTSDLEQLERLYLDELMSTDDALEGIQAFLERRDPSWRDT